MTQLLHAVHNFATVFDNNGQVDAVFLDFAKAFDRVLYCKLLHKPKQAFVSVGNAESIELPILSGVSQGSVLGPLLFFFCTNDLMVDKSSIQCSFFCR